MSDKTLFDEGVSSRERGSSSAGVAASAPDSERAVPSFDPSGEEARWREAYVTRPSDVSGYTDGDYAIAYQIGYQGRSRHKGTYEEHENDLAVEWERIKGESRLTWDQARAVIRDAWERAERQMPRNDSTEDSIRNDAMDSEPSSQVVGTGIGAAGGAAAGAGIGSMAGSIGGVIGAAIGTVVGGIAGKEMAETATRPPVQEDLEGRERGAGPDQSEGQSYEDDYAVAYRLGYEGRNFYKTSFEDNEAALEADWERLKGHSRLTWDQAKTAMREAWDRIESEMPVNVQPDDDPR
ncbi:MAG TPA: hypothetical protein PK880_15215 [Candidatus Competibacter sp.]|nr:hypothetical protein [Candidatus Competibacteraceae bacterium]HRC73860.1 hypothetical protein [Candidatus Competibacter sp.]